MGDWGSFVKSLDIETKTLQHMPFTIIVYEVYVNKELSFLPFETQIISEEKLE